MDLDVLKVKILSGYQVPCHEVDSFGQCAFQDCLNCWNAKVKYERLDGECKEAVSIFDKDVEPDFYKP